MQPRPKGPASNSSPPALLPDPRDRFLQHRILRVDEVRPLRKALTVDIPDVFADGRDAFLLQPAVLRGEIAVSLGVAGQTLVVVA